MRMSFNFTGTTNRRHVNLGNRSLAGKNKSLFLKSAQLERQRREIERTKNSAAIILQSAIRKYLNLLNWRIQLSNNWNGSSIIEFKYFFSYLINIQDFNKSLNQLIVINENLNIYSINDLKKLEMILIESFISLIPNDFNNELYKQILQLLDIIFSKKETKSIKESDRDNFSTKLFNLYSHGEIFALQYILKFSNLLSFRSLLNLFLDPRLNMVNDSVLNNWILEFIKFEDILLSYLDNNPEFVDNLSNNDKILLLSHISIALYKPELKIHNYIPYETIISVISSILNSISHNISILEENEKLNEKFNSSSNTTQISKKLFDSIKPLFQQFKSDAISTDLLKRYISSILHFVLFLNGDESTSLKLNIDINWILDDHNSDLILNCYNTLYSTTIFQNYISNIKFSDDLSFLITSNENSKWWDSLMIFQEFLSNIISLTSDETFFKAIIISKVDLINFVKFLKNFVLNVLIKYKDIKKPENFNSLSFLELFKKLLSLLHMLYIKNLKLKLFDENFWLLKNYDLELNSISSTVPIIEKLHNENSYLDDNSSSDFLQNSKLLQLYKSNVPKRVIDIFYILSYAPFMISFEKRAEIFHSFIEYDEHSNVVSEWFPTKIEGTIARNNMLLDSYKAFGNLTGTEFKKKFSVQFINEFGEKEAGIDGGGLTKELLTTLVASSFIPSKENRKNNKGLQFFKAGEHYKLYCNPEFYFKLQYERSHPDEIIPFACTNDEYLKISRFLGMVIGKCLYDNVLLDISFTSFFLNTCSKMGNTFFKNLIGDKINIVGQNNSFDEVKNLDSSLYKSLSYILLQTDPEKFEEMGLSFRIDDEFFDQDGDVHHVEIPLVPLKKKTPDSQPEPVPVTAKNKMQFVRLVTIFKLSKQSDLVMKYFIEGLFQVIKPYWLLLFNPYELQTIISGDEDAIDIDDLEKNVEYGGFLNTDQTIIDLFSILREFNKEDRGKFIKFVTSSPKQPLLGFKELNPKFGIRNSGSDKTRLPTASTCVNLLKIPDYQNKELLREKLLYSINSKAGFDLS